jgi:hypothetical protein
MALTFSHRDLVARLSASLGVAKADELLTHAAAAAGLRITQSYGKDDAIRILDRLAATPGLVGIAARCAKVQVVLSR